jgi:hypothetical protein
LRLNEEIANQLREVGRNNNNRPTKGKMGESGSRIFRDYKLVDVNHTPQSNPQCDGASTCEYFSRRKTCMRPLASGTHLLVPSDIV